MLAYIGNRGTRLPMNGAGLGLQDNMMNPAYLPLGGDALNSDITSTTAQGLSQIAAMPVDPGDGLHKPFPGFVGNVAQALRPYPQYTSVTWRSGFPGGYSSYNSLQTQYERRFSAGLQMRVAYTWSKLINNGADNGLIWAAQVQNPVNVAAERSLSFDDVPHTVIVTYTYALPFGKGRRWVNQGGIANQVVGGWNVAGIQRYNSGRPVNITVACDTCGFNVGNQKRPDKLGGGGWGGGSFDPGPDRYFNSSGWSDPGALNFGNASRTDPQVRDFPVYNEDLNLFKEFPIKHEDVKLRFETQFGNAFNRHYFCTPATVWGSGSFGQVTGMCTQPRHIDFGLKLYW